MLNELLSSAASLSSPPPFSPSSLKGMSVVCYSHRIVLLGVRNKCSTFSESRVSMDKEW